MRCSNLILMRLLKLNTPTNIDCSFKGTVRINGDLPDHLDIENLISSLDIIDEGNVFGITKFKLLIPETRRNDEEIFTTTLLSHMGFLSPRTFYVNSSVNLGSTHKYIFQEKYSKELNITVLEKAQY